MKKILFLSLLLFLLVPSLVFAKDEKKIIINEIMWMGSSASTSDEWIELYNPTDQKIDLSRWVLSGVATGGGDLVIPESLTISANGYFLISNYSDSSDKSIVDIASDWVTTSVSLANSDRKIILKDRGGNIIDQANKNLGEPLSGSSNNKWSQERVNNPQDGTKSSDWYTSSEQVNLKDGFSDCATPRAQNSKEPEEKTIKEAKKELREVVIEGTITTPPNLLFDNRLYLQDESLGIRVYLSDDLWPMLETGNKIKIRGKITSYHGELELLVRDLSDFELLSSGESINFFQIKTGDHILWEGTFIKIKGKIIETSGDTFYVDDGSGKVKIYVKDYLEINLPDKRAGDFAEIMGIINNWDGSFRILPTKQNDIKIISQKTEKPNYSLPILQIKRLPKGSLVKTRGIVSASPKKLANTYFYIQDDSSGIQIYCWYKDYPNLRIGDYIEVSGELSEIYGEKRIKIKGSNDIKILGFRGPPIAVRIKISQLKDYGGRLVTVKGRIVKTSGKTFYISDGTGVVKIYITDLSGIKKPKTYKNDLVEITGIVSQSETGLRILPRVQSDFKLLWTKPKKPKKVARASTWRKLDLKEPTIVLETQKMSGNDYLKYLGISLMIISSASLILLGGLKLRKKI